MWTFYSRAHGETEGFSHGSLAEFKGNPLQALAREICQNSLDAADGSGKPVIVEFAKTYMPIDNFPGMAELKDIITACGAFWQSKGDINTITFLNQAKDRFKPQRPFYVLRVSDYNTTGVSGAFSDEDITPWGGLVKGNAFSVKSDTDNAAGSYGIGKAAPFVTSYFQTVFYRTYDNDGVRAAMGVARLMAHNSVAPIRSGEDPVRRSVGYYGIDSHGKPSNGIPQLDAINQRTEHGTDLFIPGFNCGTTDEEWIKDILKEIVENFLYAIMSKKLVIKIDRFTISDSNLEQMLVYIGSKDAKIFYEVLRNNPNVTEMTMPFHNLGTLRLRLLYGNDLNKKILVVRSSGMKIARISSLPRMVSFTGFLELQGSELNQFFRSMENPSHNAWEPKRHGNPVKAKQYKEEVETWVVNTIAEKLMELNGAETAVNVGDCFNYTERDAIGDSSAQMTERILDISDRTETETYVPQLPSGGKISIRDEGNTRPSRSVRGRADPDGDSTGHRTRTGQKEGGQPTGRKVTIDPNGPDTVNAGEGGKPHEVYIRARVISQGDGCHKLIVTPEEDITYGRISVVTYGENCNAMKLYVRSASGDGVTAENGYITIRHFVAGEKQTIEFTLNDKYNYAMGVKAYEN